MVGKSAKALPVGRMRVIQARVPGFDGVERAVESGRLDANLADQVLAQVGGERGGVLGPRVRKEMIIDQDGDGCFAMHGGRGRARGRAQGPESVKVGVEFRAQRELEECRRLGARRQEAGADYMSGTRGEIAGSRALAW